MEKILEKTEGQLATSVVGVRLSPIGAILYFDPRDVALMPGDRVTVDTEDGVQEGVVAIGPGQVLYSEVPGPLAPIVARVEDVGSE
jgi:cell fate regulator YaaT (PSP1 superfamily)